MTDPFDLESLWTVAVAEIDRELAAARELLGRAKLTVCLAGAVGSGRPALLAALQGLDPAALGTSAPPEEPAELSLWSPPDHPEVQFALTPPIQDVDAQRRALVARYLRESADVLVFVLNANAGITRQDKDALDEFRRQGKPFLVVLSRMETLAPADRPVILGDTRARLDLGTNVPLGVSTATGDGVAELRDRLRALVETDGKGILLDRLRALRAGEADRVIGEVMRSILEAKDLHFQKSAALCVRTGVRLACLAGREGRLGRLRAALAEAFAAPRTRELAGIAVAKGAAPGSEPRVLLEALAFAILHTARALVLPEAEPAPERLREVFQGRLLEHKIRRALESGGGAVDPGHTAAILSDAMRTRDLSPARVAQVLPRVKELYQRWRAGSLTESEYVDRIGALLAGEESPAGGAGGPGAGPATGTVPAAATDAAAPPSPTLRQLAGQAIGGMAGDLVESVWQARLRPKLEQWTNEQKSLLAVDLLKLRAELEVDIDRKWGELLKRTRQEAEDFMGKAVAEITRQAEEAERRARRRLWVSSLFILGWAVLGLLYALLRRWLG